MRFYANLYNVLITSVAFLCLFTAFQTACLVSQNVLESSALDSTHPTGDAFFSLSVLYASLAALNWIAPLLVIAVGEKYAMFLGSCCYVIYVSVFLVPRDWLLYSASVLNGFGAAVLWTAQGTYITRCSDDHTINRHFSIFWSIFQTSQIWGGLYAYFTLAGITQIENSMRYRLIGALVAIGAVGWFLFLALRKPEEQYDTNTTLDAFKVEMDYEVAAIEEEQTEPMGCQALWKLSSDAFLRSFVLLRTRMMVCILVVSGFTGVIATFHLVLLSTCIGHTLAFGENAKSYIGLAGVFIGSGEVVGGTLMHLRRWIPSPGLVSLFGLTSSLAGAVILILVLPLDSPIKATELLGFLPLNISLCMLASFFLGVSGSVWNTQICSLIGSVYGPRGMDVPVAFSMYKCLQAICTAISSAYSGFLQLQWQLLIFGIFTCAALVCFLWAHWKHANEVKYELTKNGILQHDEEK